MPSPNDVEAHSLTVDTGGQGLSFQPLDDPTGQDRHGHGRGYIQNH